MTKPVILLIAIAAVLRAQHAAPPAVPPPNPLQAQSFSTFTSTTGKNGDVTLEVRNTTYQIAGQGIPGLPVGQRLLLRISTRVRQVVDEVGVRGSVQLEAWPLGTDPKQKPIYSATVVGTDARTLDNAVWIVSRGLEETEWWSVLKLGSAAHLFETYVPPVSFSISRETLTERYAGLDVPPDDTRDARLKDPHVVAILEYASGDQVIREAMITADDIARARLLRSYADVTRSLSGNGTGLTVVFTQNYPSPPDPEQMTVPIANDDLDLAHATIPAGLHIAAWTR